VLRFLVDVLADLVGMVRMRDHAALAQHPHPLDALLLADVLDDLVDDLGLVEQHGIAGAAGDHLRQLCHLGHQRVQLVAAGLLRDQEHEQHHHGHQDRAEGETDPGFETGREHAGWAQRGALRLAASVPSTVTGSFDYKQVSRG